MDRRDAMAMIECHTQCPRRVGHDGTPLRTFMDWASYLPRAWMDDWREIVRSVAFDEALSLTTRSRAKLATFHESPPPERPDDFDDRAFSFMQAYQKFLYGDLDHMVGIGKTLAKLPPVVAEDVVAHTVTLASGASTGAWVAKLTLPANRLIVLLPSPDPELLAHECAHVFYDYAPDDDDLSGLDLSAVAVAAGQITLAERHDPILQQREIAEVRATSVSKAWLLRC